MQGDVCSSFRGALRWRRPRARGLPCPSRRRTLLTVVRAARPSTGPSCATGLRGTCPFRTALWGERLKTCTGSGSSSPRCGASRPKRTRCWTRWRQARSRSSRVSRKRSNSSMATANASEPKDKACSTPWRAPGRLRAQRPSRPARRSHKRRRHYVSASKASCVSSAWPMKGRPFFNATCRAEELPRGGTSATPHAWRCLMRQRHTARSRRRTLH
mmetsp:Transcript_6343/g.20858  ORF Transcript_6343/g.20858 Transcript_6343/m.20858 type:complete len:215 (-) Transcript_6343:451-1095(-)